LYKTDFCPTIQNLEVCESDLECEVQNNKCVAPEECYSYTKSKCESVLGGSCRWHDYDDYEEMEGSCRDIGCNYLNTESSCEDLSIKSCKWSDNHCYDSSYKSCSDLGSSIYTCAFSREIIG
jgi:hypothetical protein